MILSDLILPNFYDMHKAIKNSDYLRYVFKGGRNSGKSTFIAIELVLDIIRHPTTTLCIRKVGNTLQESCYEQIKEAIDILGLSHLFKYNQSPLKITYLPRGNSIIFRGADDPAKIKSIKMSKYPITTIWIEELAEFKTEDEVTTIENSVIRASLEDGLRYKIFYSYNPPKRKQSWVNKKYETQFINSNTIVHHSTYLYNKYVSEEFKIEAEHVKKTNPQKYEWDYMGKAIGSGVVPFNNLEFMQIPDIMIKNNFDNIRQGLDFGYAVDPLHFARLHYDKTRRKIYVFGEVHEVQMGNEAITREVLKRKWNDFKIIADSAEPKSIAQIKAHGINIVGAIKRPGSVEYGEKWLDELEAIIIDPQRSPNTAREFESIDYKVDKDGNTLPKLEDKDNHSIDAVRYALSEDMRASVFSFK